MGQVLVAYFSASGVTRKLAERLAEVAAADVYEIVPETLYSKADLNWMDRDSRSTLEMSDMNCRPALADRNADIENHDVIYVGFPIWWYREPSIIDSFLDAYDFSGKTIIPFATSGSSGMGDTAKRFRQLLGPEVNVKDGARLKARASEDELKELIRENS